MDEETKRYLDTLRGQLDTLRAQMNDNFERVLNRLGSIERDFQNAKEFLVGEALVSSRRWLDLEARVAKLEGKGGV